MITHTSNKSKLIAAAEKSSKFNVHTFPWGYSVRMRERSGFWARLAQALAGGTAFASVGIAVGMWVIPGSDMSMDLALFKLAMSGFLALVAILALWFASQGSIYELQIDQKKREIREVLRNKRNQNFVLRRFAFEKISSVTLSRDQSINTHGHACLMLRHVAQTHSISLVTDKKEHLEALREILAHDILTEKVASVGQQEIVPRRITPRAKAQAMTLVAR